MVKAYLRYEALGNVGVISSSGLTFDSSGEILFTGTLESVTAWHARKGLSQFQLKEEEMKGEVTEVTLSPNKIHIAVGYTNGSIRIWDTVQKKCTVTLNGHRNAVTALRYNKEGTLLVSGSRDTAIIVWDTVSESGLYRLNGHKDMITDCVFLDSSKRIISASKDSFVKIWDMETQHCVQTLVGHRAEVWSIDVNPSETRLVTGSVDNKLRVWSLDPSEFETLQQTKSSEEEVDPVSKMIEDEGEENVAVFFGSIERPGTNRVERLRFNASGTLLGCHVERSVYLFAITPTSEVSAKAKKRFKKEKKRLKKMEVDIPEKVRPSPVDELTRSGEVVSSHRIRAFAFSPVGNNIALSLSNNRLELYSHSKDQYEKNVSIELPGHRSDIRDVALSSDDLLMASTSSNSVKIWNTRSMSSIKTMPSGYGLCCAFLPGNKHVIVGTKEGNLELYELASASCIESAKAHEGAIWSLDIRPDKVGFVTGGADKEIKFWTLELVPDERNPSSKRLGFSHTRTLKMSDDVLCVRFSPNGELLAASLLDSTVKIFKEKSLEFFLSLYGHKLPVMSFDISSDSSLIVTASADKNIKIWGLDFGDCHKSIFAHDDSVMQVKFVPGTHYFFSGSKDRVIKYWDADKFLHVQTLTGHHGFVWCMAVNSSGDFLVTGSQDRSIRFWVRTEEQLFVEEEREKELEALFEVDVSRMQDEQEGESGPASKKTMETIRAGEILMEAIELAQKEREAWNDYLKELETVERSMSAEEKEEKVSKGESLLAPPQPNPLLLGRPHSDYLLRVLKSIRSAELEEALIILPFHVVENLFWYLNEWMKEGKSAELVCRCAFFLLRVHQKQIVASRAIPQVLESLKTRTREHLQRQKDVMGFNRSAMKFMKRSLELSTNKEFFEDQLANFKEKKKPKLLE